MKLAPELVMTWRRAQREYPSRGVTGDACSLLHGSTLTTDHMSIAAMQRLAQLWPRPALR
jgi:hypothetical protein